MSIQIPTVLQSLNDRSAVLQALAHLHATLANASKSDSESKAVSATAQHMLIELRVKHKADMPDAMLQNAASLRDHTTKIALNENKEHAKIETDKTNI